MALYAGLRKAGQRASTISKAWYSDSLLYQEFVRCRSIHNTSVGAANGRPQAEIGKEQQAKIAKLMQLVIPEVPIRPNRTPEELADAAVRAKEYSRQCMRALRAIQNRQKERDRLRDDAILSLPLELKMSALTPVEEGWPMKILPPFATPPKAPKWRF